MLVQERIDSLESSDFEELESQCSNRVFARDAIYASSSTLYYVVATVAPHSTKFQVYSHSEIKNHLFEFHDQSLTLDEFLLTVDFLIRKPSEE